MQSYFRSVQVVRKTASSDQEADVFILQAWAGHTPFCAQDPLFIKQGLEGSLQDFFQDSKSLNLQVQVTICTQGSAYS